MTPGVGDLVVFCPLPPIGEGDLGIVLCARGLPQPEAQVAWVNGDRTWTPVRYLKRIADHHGAIIPGHPTDCTACTAAQPVDTIGS